MSKVDTITEWAFFFLFLFYMLHLRLVDDATGIYWLSSIRGEVIQTHHIGVGRAVHWKDRARCFYGFLIVFDWPGCCSTLCLRPLIGYTCVSFLSALLLYVSTQDLLLNRNVITSCSDGVESHHRGYFASWSPRTLNKAWWFGHLCSI